MANAVTCPQCGSEMLLDRTPDRRAIIKAMKSQGKSDAYATNFADAVHEKREALGPVATCPHCRYNMRIAPAKPGKKDQAA